MNNPAFIVDGFTEVQILKKICPNSPIKRTDLNGKDVTIPAMARKIASHIRLLKRNYPIVILVDLEKRKMTFEEMALQLRNEIENQGINNIDFRIGVADRMIENWILADWDTLMFNLNLSEEKPEFTDGIGGKAKMKKLIPNYGETADGVSHFLKANSLDIYENSPSFKHFADQLKDLNCYWLKTE